MHNPAGMVWAWLGFACACAGACSLELDRSRWTKQEDGGYGMDAGADPGSTPEPVAGAGGARAGTGGAGGAAGEPTPIDPATGSDGGDAAVTDASLLADASVYQDASVHDAALEAGGEDVCSPACAGDLACMDGQCHQAATRLVLGGYVGCAMQEPANSDSARPVVCWGSNLEGLLRAPSLGTGLDRFRASPAALPGIGPVRDIGVRAWFSWRTGTNSELITEYHQVACVLEGNSEDIHCWGNMEVSQLLAPGVGGTIRVPQATAVAVGIRHACALTRSGQVRCWGSNAENQLGNAASSGVESRTNPVSVDGLSDALELSAGDGSTCAVRSNGRVACWGYLPGHPDAPLVRDIASVDGTALGDAVQVDVGGAVFWDNACARRATGGVVCWGFNRYGQLGIGVTGEDFRTYYSEVMGPPGEDGPLSNIVDIATGGGHACAVHASGQVYCWGANSGGRMLNNVSAENVTRPHPVPGLTDAIDVEIAGAYTCARRRTGQVVCWGDNRYGQLGDGTRIDRLTPVNVLHLP